MEPRPVRRRVAHALARSQPDEIQLHLLRPRGLSQHRASATYDPLQRDLDQLALLTYDALRAGGVEANPPRLARYEA